ENERTRRANELVAERDDLSAAAGVRLGILPRELAHDAGHLTRRGVDGRAVAQSRDDVQPMVAALFARARAAVDRQPELGLAFARELKGFRQHANDRRRTPIEGDRAADDGGVESEAPLPEAVRDDDDLRRVRGVLA